MNADRLLALYEAISEAPDAIPRLRRFVLDLAVRGKLVPQDRNDEPVAGLLTRMRVAKSRNEVSSNRRANPKSRPISPSEIPIATPPTWGWARLCDIGNLSGGMTPSMGRSEYWHGEIVWLSPKDIKADELFDSELKISSRGLEETNLNLYPPGSLFIVARSGILKRQFPVAINRVPAAANQDMKVLVPFLQGHERYLQVMFRGLTTFLLKSLVKTGTTVQSLKYDEFEQQPFPLPPLSEQHKIVAKVDELMALCDRLESARTEREERRSRLTNASLARLSSPESETFLRDARLTLDSLPLLTSRSSQIGAFRQAILSVAVRGKLVKQDKNEGMARDELAKLARERDALARARGSRRERESRPIAPTDQPFAIPDSWVWSRVGDAVLFTQYGTSQQSTRSSLGVPVLTMGNIQQGAVLLGDEKKIPVTSEELPELYLKKLDLLYNRTNSAELVGKTGIYLGEDDSRTFASYLIRIRPSIANSCPQYLNLAMNSPVFRETQIVPLIKKQTGQANVNGTALLNMLVPIPPVAEQRRIVARVGELLGVCDQLERSLSAADDKRSRLLNVLLAEALEGRSDAIAA